MKRFVTIVAATTLAACSQSGDDAAADTTEAAVAQSAEPSMDSMAGTYEYTLEDGTGGTTVLTTEGAYTDTMGDIVETGTWSLADGKTCFDPEGDEADAPTRCYDISDTDAVGMQTATAEDGTVVKLRKQPA